MLEGLGSLKWGVGTVVVIFQWGIDDDSVSVPFDLTNSRCRPAGISRYRPACPFFSLTFVSLWGVVFVV